jgi:hypothetical protein
MPAIWRCSQSPVGPQQRDSGGARRDRKNTCKCPHLETKVKCLSDQNPLKMQAQWDGHLNARRARPAVCLIHRDRSLTYRLAQLHSVRHSPCAQLVGVRG